MADKRDLLIQVNGFAGFFGLGDGRQAKKQLKDIELLRNKLAHGEDLIADSSWEALLAIPAVLDTFLRRFDENRDVFVQRFGKSGPGIGD